MKRLLLFILAMGFFVPCWSQEVVIFKNGRSLLVVSHQEKAGWTYLKLMRGDMAVPSAAILRISPEKVKAVRGAKKWKPEKSKPVAKPKHVASKPRPPTAPKPPKPEDLQRYLRNRRRQLHRVAPGNSFKAERKSTARRPPTRYPRRDLHREPQPQEGGWPTKQ